MRAHALALALTLTGSALTFAQTSQPLPGTVTAEATEVVRVKPDQAKVYATASSRNADATVASDEAADLAKRFTQEVQKMPGKGLKATADAVKVSRMTDERVVLRGGAVPPTEMHASQQVVITITDADPKTLTEAVEKVQRAAIKEGLTGSAADAYPLSSRYSTDTVRVAYLKQDGMDDLLTAALGKATKKATARAEAIATGLGMKLGAVVAAEELSGTAGAAADPAGTFGTSALRATAVSTAGDLVEGELLRTVRVRVVYAVK